MTGRDRGGGLSGVIRPFSDLSFRHVTTKTKAYCWVFGFFRIFFCQTRYPTPVKSLFKTPMGKQIEHYFGKQSAIFFSSSYIILY